MKKEEKPRVLITKEQVEKFELLQPLMDAALIEVKEFSKKKPDGVLNALKVNIINRLLTEIKTDVLKGDPSIKYLDFLDEETLPHNSDAVLILSQFQAAMKQFKAKHYQFNGMEWTWHTEK